MKELDYGQDPTDLILGQLRQDNLRRSAGENVRSRYFQVEYAKKKILNFNPEEAQRYQKTLEEENSKEYLQEVVRDNNKYTNLKEDLKQKYFKLRPSRNNNQKEVKTQDPMELIKSYYHLQNLQSNQRSVVFARILSQSRSRLGNESRVHYTQQIQRLLTDSIKATFKQQRSRIKGGTQWDKERENQVEMIKERREILSVAKQKEWGGFSAVDQIPNRQKYGLDFMSYQRRKSRGAIERWAWQTRVRRAQGPLEKFQEFMLRQVKMKQDTREKLQKFYMKMREQFRRVSKKSSALPSIQK